ncbi:GDSL-type esterase/lipase family protein [Microvirga makkahensis]|uniref:SGNH/GDSL hydrolase family protein n=1 Tax=Microvirga makkahensis TaxID=1128670 RepID=A0A7X3MRT2_9HYPH|nr:SGNH/GDSL hydrolase family protein [Microvirga makkahensis]
MTRQIFTAHEAATTVGAKLARREPVRVLAIGSSSTEGIGASSPEHSYPAQLEDELREDWKSGVTVVNAGKGGETGAQTLERLEAALKAQSFDLVIWQVGTNDAIKGVSEEDFRAILERGIASVRASGASLMLLDQQYFPTIRNLGRYERFVGMVGTLARERKVAVFSRYALMLDWNSQSPEELRSMLSGDGFHMSDKGYDCLADQVAEAIQSLVSPARHSGQVTSNQVAKAR